ncbi:MAG: hypothetical protein E7Z99_07305 [Coriobacteriaceae bacterium]|nr:hypothetical protein [Coriobacteriaceae bacterium]
MKSNRAFEAPNAKRLALFAHDALFLALLAAIAISAAPAPAYAYVDPSVMTYTIQAVAGVAVALSAVAGVAFRKSRKKIMKLLKIDENAKKAVDPRWSMIDDVEGNRYNDCGTEEYLSRVMPGKASVGRGGDEPEKLPFARRLALALAASAFLVVTFFVLPPFEMLAGNEGSLVFGLADAWQPVLLAAFIALLGLAIVLTALRGKAFSYALLIVFCFALGCYLQALFLNSGLPTTDGRPVDWGNYQLQAVVSTLVWAVVFVAAFVLFKKYRGAMQVAVAVVSVALVIVQGVASVSLIADKVGERAGLAPGEYPASMYRLTEKGMFSVSPSKNTIVFVLDTFDTTDMMRLTSDDPNLAEKLQGFTWFKDSVGSLCPTRYGAPFLWTGVYPSADEEFVDYIQNRYRQSSFLSDIQAEGYSIGLYTDPVGDFNLPDQEKRDLIYDKTINIKPDSGEDASFLDYLGTMQIMARASLYRDLPWLAKPFVYYNTDQVNQAMAVEGAALSDPDNAPYVMEDTHWFSSLKHRGLSFEEEGYNGAYRFIHLNGTHIPYYVTASGEHAGRETSLEEQARGSMEMVTYYLDELKRLGVYKDATIIITADHGIWWECPEGEDPYLSSPLMLVKPAGASEGELQVSDADICAYDVLPTVIKSIGGNTSAYGPTIFEQPENGRERRYIFTRTESNVDYRIDEYLVNGDVLDPSSWSATGVSWDGTNVPH